MLERCYCWKSEMRWRIPVTAVVDICINTVCPHLNDHHRKHWHQGAKTKTWREKTRRAEDLLKDPSAGVRDIKSCLNI